jgi:hypothetical protein
VGSGGAAGAFSSSSLVATMAAFIASTFMKIATAIIGKSSTVSVETP